MLIDFIYENKNNYICISGFRKISVYQIIKNINELKGTNIRFIEFSNELSQYKFEKHLLTKEDRLKKLHNKLENITDMNAEDYMKVANSIFGERNAKERRRIIAKKQL